MVSCVAGQVGLADLAGRHDDRSQHPHLASVIDAKGDVEYSTSQGAKVNWSPVMPYWIATASWNDVVVCVVAHEEPRYPWATIPMNSGAPITEASSCWAIVSIVIR
jgi:hypothetical protein